MVSEWIKINFIILSSVTEVSLASLGVLAYFSCSMTEIKFKFN